MSKIEIKADRGSEIDIGGDVSIGEKKEKKPKSFSLLRLGQVGLYLYNLLGKLGLGKFVSK